MMCTNKWKYWYQYYSKYNANSKYSMREVLLLIMILFNVCIINSNNTIYYNNV